MATIDKSKYGLTDKHDLSRLDSDELDEFLSLGGGRSQTGHSKSQDARRQLLEAKAYGQDTAAINSYAVDVETGNRIGGDGKSGTYEDRTGKEPAKLDPNYQLKSYPNATPTPGSTGVAGRTVTLPTGQTLTGTQAQNYGNQLTQAPLPSTGNPIQDAINQAQQVSQSLQALTDKGYGGSTDLSTLPQDVDISNLPAKGQTTSATTGGTTLSTLLASAGIQTDTKTKLPDIVKELSKLYGMKDINDEIEGLDDQYANDVMEVNDNPWLSEAMRSDKISLLEQKYETKKNALTDRLALQNDLIGQAINLYNSEREYQQENLKMAMQQKQQEIENELEKQKLAQIDTQVVQLADGSDVLINSQTGQRIATLGGRTVSDGISGDGTGGGGGGGSSGANSGFQVISDITGKPLTDAERSAVGYANRAQASSDIVSSFGQRFTDILSLIGQGAPNISKSPERQQFEQAQRDFVNAVLRRESGAAISESEFENARKQYFPQAGDSAAVVQQKAENRQRTINSLYLSGGRVTNTTTPPQSPAPAPEATENFFSKAMDWLFGDN